MPAIQGGGACFNFSQGLLKVGNDVIVYASRMDQSGTEYFPMQCNTVRADKLSDLRTLGRGSKPETNR